MGDDGVGARVARLLAADAALTARVDVICGGTDLLRYMELMEGRERVILIDAAEGGEPGEISVVDELPSDSGRESAHALSPVQSLQLLRTVSQALDSVRFTWVLVHIRAAEMRPELSPEIQNAVSHAAKSVRESLA
jgi:hydrogenase maturation protease